MDPRNAGEKDATGYWSHGRTVDRFDRPEVAAKYPAEYGSSFRERRERSSLLRAIAGIPDGSHVLDLPCGTGRLTPLLLGAGMRVTGADSSAHMVELAQRRWGQQNTDNRPTAAFEVRDVMDTGYEDGRFDAVVCNRLLHHFNESATRVSALAELARITNGPVIVSFFCSFALDAVRFRLKHWMRRTVPRDRIPIPLGTFTADVEAAGLTIARTVPVLWGLSPMWYVVAHSAAESGWRGDGAGPIAAAA